MFGILLLLLTLLLAFHMNAGGESGGPVAGATSPLGWYIESGDNVSYDNMTIYLNGDLNIQHGGTLNFDNVTMYSNARGDKDAAIKIVVEEGGTFNIKNSLITATIQVSQEKGNQPFRYKFNVYGFLLVQGSTISYLWGEINGAMVPGTPLPGGYMVNTQGGLEIHSDNVTVRDSTITQSQSGGIIIMKGSPVVENCELIENGHMGLAVVDGASHARIENCTMNSNEFFGMTASSPYLELRNNAFDNNRWMGIIINGAGNLTIYNCSDTGNSLGAWVIHSNPYFINSVVNNTDGNARNFQIVSSNVTLINTPSNISGNRVSLDSGSSVSAGWHVDVHVEDKNGRDAENASVTLRSSSGNFTFTRYFTTDDSGWARGWAPFTVRRKAEWHNISFVTVMADYRGNTARANKTLNGNLEVFLKIEGEGGGILGAMGNSYSIIVGVAVLAAAVGAVYWRKGKAGEE